MHAHLDLTARVGLDDAEQLDHVAEFAGKGDVARGDALDALDEHFFRRHPEAIGQRSEDDRLVRGVAAVHVERGIGLRVTRRLRLGQRLGKAQPALGHAREDVVTRAVDDPVDRADVVADKRLADRLDDRNPARHRRLEKDRHLVLRRRLENLLPVLREQRLVAGDDHFSPLDRPENQPQAFVLLPHQLDHDLNRRIIEQLLPPRRQQTRRHAHPAIPRHVAHRDLFHLQLTPQTLPQQGTIQRQVLEDTRADITHSSESDSEGLHAKGRGLSRSCFGV